MEQNDRGLTPNLIWTPGKHGEHLHNELNYSGGRLCCLSYRVGCLTCIHQHSRVTSCQTSEGVAWRWIEGQLLCCATACDGCVRLCVLASPAALRWDTLSGCIWILFEPVKTATGLHTHQTLASSLPRQSVAIFIPADAFHRAHLFLPLHLCKVTKVL